MYGDGSYDGNKIANVLKARKILWKLNYGKWGQEEKLKVVKVLSRTEEEMRYIIINIFDNYGLEYSIYLDDCKRRDGLYTKREWKKDAILSNFCEDSQNKILFTMEKSGYKFAKELDERYLEL